MTIMDWDRVARCQPHDATVHIVTRVMVLRGELLRKFEVSTRTKILMWQKYRTQKNGCCIFLRSIVLPLEVVWFGSFNRFAEAADYFVFEKHSLAILCPG